MNISSIQANHFWQYCIDYIDKRTNLDNALSLSSDETNPKLTRMPDLYKRLLVSLTNRQGMPNSIGDVGALSELLFRFNPNKVSNKYQGSWKVLFKEIEKKVKPKSRMAIDIPQNYWVIFSKGAIDSACFLSKFKSGPDFVKCVDNSIENEAFIPSIPMLLSLEITGLGFPLACDFLKEAGWNEYAKPDTHTKHILGMCGFSSGKDYDTFKCIRKIASDVSESPYRVDKIIWLIGSGNLYNTGESFDTDRDEFVDQYLSVC